MKIKIKFNFLDRVLVNFYVIVIQNGNTVKKYWFIRALWSVFAWMQAKRKNLYNGASVLKRKKWEFLYHEIPRLANNQWEIKKQIYKTTMKYIF